MCIVFCGLVFPANARNDNQSPINHAKSSLPAYALSSAVTLSDVRVSEDELLAVLVLGPPPPRRRQLRQLCPRLWRPVRLEVGHVLLAAGQLGDEGGAGVVKLVPVHGQEVPVEC